MSKANVTLPKIEPDEERFGPIAVSYEPMRARRQIHLKQRGQRSNRILEVPELDEETPAVRFESKLSRSISNVRRLNNTARKDPFEREFPYNESPVVNNFNDPRPGEQKSLAVSRKYNSQSKRAPPPP